MATRFLVLAQSAPIATTLTDIYTVPALTSASVKTISICNRGATSTTFRISIARAGAADATSQYICYDVSVQGNDTAIITADFTMTTTDILRVFAGNANLTFQIFGGENI